MNKINISVQECIKNFLKDYEIDNPDLVYLVGFSGGYDSMCLLDNLKKVSKNKIVAIHLNHNWRGAESDKEEVNCREFCKKIGVEFYSEKLKDGISQTETAARSARYEFFEKCAQKFNSRVIFTAHNKNDQAETLIYRICHGTGIKGLCGISLQRDIFYRPLLNVARNDIEKYCAENNLTPNNDSSNKDTIHKRNLIRSEILPKMAEINPDIVSALVSLAQIAREETEIIKNLVPVDNVINMPEYLNMSESLQKRLLYEIISPLVPQNYDRERILTVWNFVKENCKSKSGKRISITTDYWLFVSSQILELVKKSKHENINIKINKIGEYSCGGITVKISEYDDKADQNNNLCKESILVDLSGIDFDFELRNRHDGDIIKPMGLNGTQKLKKYLNERKIPNHRKDKLLFLTQGNEILWAVGLGISDKIKVKTIPTHKIVIKRRAYEN